MSLAKHGTLNEGDLVDAREVDLDQILEHTYSASTSHLFGKVGLPPPDSAVVMEKRYTKVWGIEGDKPGMNFVGLSKSNSSSKGRFQVPNLSPGHYKLVVKLLKPETTVFGLAVKPVGAILSNMQALGASPDKREQVLGRGMPTEYVSVQVHVSSSSVGGESELLMNSVEELDQGRDSLVRSFSISDRNSVGNLDLICTSFSLIKRMRVSAELFRCDLPSKQKLAKQGRQVMNKALSSGKIAVPARNNVSSKPKRSVHIEDSCDVHTVLEKFYFSHCREKVAQVSQIMSFFQKRDGNLGILFATLEDKYGVTFQPNGEWK